MTHSSLKITTLVGLLSSLFIWISALISISEGNELLGIIFFIVHISLIAIAFPIFIRAMSIKEKIPMWFVLAISVIAIANLIAFILASDLFRQYRWFLILMSVFELIPFPMFYSERTHIM